MTKITGKLTEDNLKTGKYWANMVRYKETDFFNTKKAGQFDDFDLLVSEETIADYCDKFNIVDTHEYRIQGGRSKYLYENIHDTADKIIKTADYIVEENMALLTFFDDSRQLVKVINLKWEEKND